MRYSKKQDITEDSGQSAVIEGKEENLTPKQKKHLEETKRLHDKAFRRLSQM